MVKADKIIYNIQEILTPTSTGNPLFGSSMNEITSIKNGYIAIKDGKILKVDQLDYQVYKGKSTTCIDALGKIALPGFIDSHTHVCHAGSREYELEKKLKGISYLTILQEGGGIHSTVKATKTVSKETLISQTLKSLDHMLNHGVTSVESKSGYGLDEETELKQLRAIKKISTIHPMHIESTYMGAHALPKAYEKDREAFLNNVIALYPIIKKESLATFVDVFCEEGAFTVSESEFILKKALEYQFDIKIHADEIKSIGASELAGRLKATSADHLVAITQEGIKALKDHGVIATLLPATSFYLKHDYAKARMMIDEGLAVALASDYNPGSSPSENYLFTLSLAALYLNMTPNEILTAATINAASALKLNHHKGLIKEGYDADIILLEANNWPYVLYHHSINHVSDVMIKGKFVKQDHQLIWRNDYEAR
ncbi:MAG: imidazolonepropionase [Candidatus Izemoplasmataceae bacterium]